MAERKIVVKNVSIMLHVANTPILGDHDGRLSAGRSNVDANNIAHTIMAALAKEGFKFPDMKYEVVK